MDDRVIIDAGKHSFTVLIPLASLVEPFEIVYSDELEDCLGLNEKVEHINYFLTESAEPLLHFGIHSYPIDNHLVIHQCYRDNPGDYVTALTRRLRRCLYIVSDAFDILEGYVDCSDEARSCYVINYLASSYDATMYFVRFMMNRGDDTGFDYHCTFVIVVLEILIAFLSGSYWQYHT